MQQVLTFIIVTALQHKGAYSKGPSCDRRDGVETDAVEIIFDTLRSMEWDKEREYGSFSIRIVQVIKDLGL